MLSTGDLALDLVKSKFSRSSMPLLGSRNESSRRPLSGIAGYPMQPGDTDRHTPGCGSQEVDIDPSTSFTSCSTDQRFSDTMNLGVVSDASEVESHAYMA